MLVKKNLQLDDRDRCTSNRNGGNGNGDDNDFLNFENKTFTVIELQHWSTRGDSMFRSFNG